MATRDDIASASDVRRQLNLSEGVTDSELDSLRSVALAEVEGILGYRLVDAETTHEVAPPASATESIWIPHARVHGVVFGGSTITAWRNRLDDGTDASVIGYVLANLPTGAQGEALESVMTALRSTLAVAFDYASLLTSARGLESALTDASYTAGDVISTVQAVEQDIGQMFRQVPYVVRFNPFMPSDYVPSGHQPYSNWTQLQPSTDTGGWSEAMQRSETPLRYAVYAGTPASDIPPEVKHAVLYMSSALWTDRGDDDTDILDKARKQASRLVMGARLGRVSHWS